MHITIQVDGKLLKNISIPDGLSTKHEYEFLYAALYNDIDVRKAIGSKLKKVEHTPGKILNLITGRT